MTKRVPAKPTSRVTKRAPSTGRAAESSFDEVVQLIEAARQRAVRAVNVELIELYWQIGAIISRRIESEGWGKGTVQALATHLQRTQPGMRGFSAQNLWRMRQFFDTYRDLPDLSTLVRELSWSANLRILSGTKRAEERDFYLRLASQNAWNVRELARQIDAGLFERALLAPPQLSTALREMHPAAADVFRDAYVLEFLELPEGHSEADLHRGLVRHLGRFITELGRDFCFVGSEYPVQVGKQDFAIDLVFFHRGLACLVAIELKIREFRPEEGITVGTFATEDEAVAAIALFVDAQNSDQPYAGMSLRAWGRKWLEKRELDGVHRSPKKDGYVWRRIDASELGALPLAAITPRDIRNWIAKQIRTPTERKKRDGTVVTGKPPARQTILNALNLLRVSLEDACNDHHLETNPARDVKVPRIARTKMPWTYLTADEIEKLTGPLVEQPNRDVFTFAIFSGLREGEIFGLQWDDVDLDARTAHIRVSWKGTPTKRGHVRTLNLFEPAAQALKRQKERTSKGAYVFARRDGEPYSHDYDGDVGKWLKHVGITRHVRFHDLRHTCASHLVSGTWGRAWSIEEVASHLGHSSSATSRRYAHLSPDGLKRAIRETRPELHRASQPLVSTLVSKRLTRTFLRSRNCLKSAEEKGFEPLVELPPRRFSKPWAA